MLINVYSMQKPCKDYFVIYNFYTYSIITHANTIKTILALLFFMWLSSDMSCADLQALIISLILSRCLAFLIARKSLANFASNLTFTLFHFFPE